MRFGFRLSLREKLLGVVLLTTLVALLVALGAIIGYDLQVYHRDATSDLTTQAELLGRTSAAALAFDDPRAAQENLGLLRFRPKMRAAAIYKARGGVFAKYVVSGQNDGIPKLPEADGTRVENGEMLVFKRIVDNGEILGTVYLRAGYELYDRVWDYAWIAGLVLVAAMLVALLMSAWLQKFVTRPILAIGAVAREVVEQRDYSRRARKTSDDEVGALVESFNDMLAEIERHARESEASNREIAREAEERRVAQQEVQRLNEELELRVQERTTQLQISNEELARAKEAAENANQAKSAFLSSMSHELRTPLNAILGFGQILAAEAMPLTPEQRKDFVNYILKAGRHLLTLINEILDLAHIESGKVSVSLEPVSLAEILAECQTMVEPLATPRNIRLVFPKDVEWNVVADRTRLKQVLLNLLSNAIKYNREMGAVVVDCATANPERVRLSVQDTGKGLAPEQIAALFQPFNRLGQEAGSEEGTGIGLVVTKRLVELMGGEIGVTSTVGIGTVFWIELKATAPSPSVVADNGKAPPEVKAERGDESLPTLLYVEDNPANLSLVEELIGLRGDLRLLSAPDGHLGIELARAHLPQVILMDLNLPGINGSDAQLILRSDPRTKHIPVIALTANAMPRDIAKGLAQGFFRYLTKPIDIDDLTEAIDSALEFAARRQGRDEKATQQ